MSDTTSTQQTTQTPAAPTTGNSTSEGGAPTFTPEDYRSMQEQLRSANSKIGELSKTSKTVERLQKAFAPEEAPADPDESFLDTYLQAAVDAEKGGAPIPLTTNLAVKLIESRRQAQELQRRIDQIEGKIQAHEDPMINSDRQAYAGIDAQLEQSLADTYGESGYPPQLLTAAANQVVEEIKRLKAENPAAWDAIKRNPNNQKAMARHFVEKIIPDRAKQSMQREYLQNYKMQAPELMQAFREAGQIEDPATRARLKESIRQQLLSSIWENKKSSSQISKLYRQG